MSFSFGQKFVQIGPNLAQSIPSVCRLNEESIFFYGLPVEKVRFMNEKWLLTRITNFKNRSFYSGHRAVQIKPKLVQCIPNVCRV